MKKIKDMFANAFTLAFLGAIVILISHVVYYMCWVAGFLFQGGLWLPAILIFVIFFVLLGIVVKEE